MTPRVMVVYGTRPEAIKVAPVVKALLRDDRFDTYLLSTGQHREMLEQVNMAFGLEPYADLGLLAPGQTLNQLTSRMFGALDAHLARISPDVVLVQGDTTTVAAAGIASFYREVPVAHLEAGLRSHNLHSPFPEEGNRKLVSQIASLHLSPTREAHANLLRESIAPQTIAITGNTVIDALLEASKWPTRFDDPALAPLEGSERPLILVTVHRRENWGEPLERIGAALRAIALEHPTADILWPAHRNPLLRATIMPFVDDLPNVVVTEPLEYPQFVHALNLAHVVLTDSGGVQEEAPSLGKPVLVLRENTERPEAVAAGTVKLIGTATDDIVSNVRTLMTSPAAYAEMARSTNPYGDGLASDRVVAALAELLGVGTRLPDFAPGAPRD